MTEPSDNPFSFLSGFVQDRNIIRVIAQIDAIKDAGGNESQTMRWTRSDRQWQYFPLDWHASRICVASFPEDTLIAVGPAGMYLEGTSSGTTEGRIVAGEDGPLTRGAIRDLRLIGRHAYVAGMSRQVYQRTGPGTWTRHDLGVVQPRGSMDAVGFNAIDGIDENEIYAVGFGGEIWHYQDGLWRESDSLTNAVLHRVRVIDKNTVYIAGQKGVLIKGSVSRWQVIAHDATEQDFWGMEWFKGYLYLACDEGIFRLNGDDSLTRIDLGLGEEWTCRHLHANDGILCSFGPKHIAFTEDVIRWNVITP